MTVVLGATRSLEIDNDEGPDGTARAECGDGSLALVGLLGGCSTTTASGGAAHRRDLARWDRGVVQVVAQARAYLDQRLDQRVAKPAIVLDVDDTSLATHPLEPGPDWGKSEAEKAAEDARLPAITPTRDFARYAAQQGVGIFFVTGRTDDPELRHATLVNLGQQGYPEATGLIMRPIDDHDSSVVPYKSGARAGIEQQGYHLLESIGDQQSDLDGGHAERGFKLPTMP